MQTRDDRETTVIRNDFANAIAAIERERAATAAAAAGTSAAIKRVPIEMRNYPATSLARKLAAAAGVASLSGNREVVDMIMAVQKHQSRARCAITPCFAFCCILSQLLLHIRPLISLMCLCDLNSIMEDNQIAAQAQKEYYELANAASDKLRRAKALMDSKQPQYEQALSLLDEGLAVSGAVRRAGVNGDELMVRQNLASVTLCQPAVSC